MSSHILTLLVITAIVLCGAALIIYFGVRKQTRLLRESLQKAAAGSVNEGDTASAARVMLGIVRSRGYELGKLTTAELLPKTANTKADLQQAKLLQGMVVTAAGDCFQDNLLQKAGAGPLPLSGPGAVAGNAPSADTAALADAALSSFARLALGAVNQTPGRPKELSFKELCEIVGHGCYALRAIALNLPLLRLDVAMLAPRVTNAQEWKVYAKTYSRIAGVMGVHPDQTASMLERRLESLPLAVRAGAL